ncbi:hypothetical protein GCM10009759_69070 [Kitasatospora saccharophila]|uniref:Nudix hydrolase domain-containing protein n=2 Tax=Kitasatospora saccharophila TaxID=407973 RepID=A0ABP5JU67_9ACTN
MSARDGAAGGVPVRVCAVLVDPGGRVCVIRRHRPGGAQHSLPGGLAASGERPVDALRRELAEELGLDLAAAGAEDVEEFGLVLRFEQHQATIRPGRDGLFRRRHLIYAARLPRPLAAVTTQASPEADGPVLLAPMTDATFRWR